MLRDKPSRSVGYENSVYEKPVAGVCKEMDEETFLNLFKVELTMETNKKIPAWCVADIGPDKAAALESGLRRVGGFVQEFHRAGAFGFGFRQVRTRDPGVSFASR